MARGAKTIVLFARKPVPGASTAAERAKTGGVRIVTIALDADPEAEQSLARLADLTGGQSRAYSAGKLWQWADQADLD